jgi:hypothetical protein
MAKGRYENVLGRIVVSEDVRCWMLDVSERGMIFRAGARVERMSAAAERLSRKTGMSRGNRMLRILRISLYTITANLQVDCDIETRLFGIINTEEIPPSNEGG